ncbi:hypothetical protein CspeluHIS016_0302570 [Cutaneotrichosporon spelunceum]|uniref:Uncharacterized protein n=1 Tax=Cutaneotrichosporon spelunceum TaxID=1672016 RepID=A0AAD3TT45_9TREE|nr:hypothetical protein CspeluHIS016_0302570 [Cutaneotrichosporon spelunceum]
MPIDDPPQTLEDRVQAESFMHKHGMLPETGTDAYGSGVYACTFCLSTKARCLVPLLAHIGHKRFRAHPCLRCEERGCSLAGTVMSGTASGGMSLEKPESVGTSMIQLGGQVSMACSITSTTTHTEVEKLGSGLRRMQRKPSHSSRISPDTRSKSPNQASRAGSPPIQLPTPRNSSPSHTGSSEGAVSALVSSSPPTSTKILHLTDNVLSTTLAPTLSVGDSLTKLMSRHETKQDHSVLGRTPAPPTALAAFASTIHITKRRRLSSLALGPGLSTVSRSYDPEEYCAALNSARTEMHTAEAAHEGAVATLATAQHMSTLTAEALARIEAEVARIEEERRSALSHAAACTEALERARDEAAVVVVTAQESVTAVAAQLEERAEAYYRVVRGFIVE